MKTITKLFTVTLLAGSLFSATSSNAQTMPMSGEMTGPKFKIGVGVSGGITNSDSPFSYALGADLKLQLDLMKYVSITASGGYTRLMEKEGGLIASYDFIPAIGGVKIYPAKDFYFTGFMGAGFAIKDGSKTSFIYGGGLGYEMDKGLEIGVRYEAYQQDVASSTYQPVNGQYALRVGFNF